MAPECKICKKDTEKRVVIQRNPLKKLDTLLPNGYEEFYCNNKIKTKRIWNKDIRGKNVYKWIEEECRNNIIVKK